MRFAASALTLTALLAASVSAQIPIRLGQTLNGRLTTTDPKFSDGSRYKMYAFVGNRGDTVAVDLTSDDFDANLLITDASGNSLARNDDGGDACNARLTFVAPSAGNYRVYANSSAPAELGDYKIALARGRARVASDTVCRGFGRVAGMIEIGQTINGSLTSNDPEFTGDSTYFQRWILPAKAFQTFTVDLESSDFDAYLLLTRGRGDKLVENDDGGGGCNARLVYSPQDDHPLRIVVNTASRPHHQTGSFTLKVTEGESQTEPKGNCRFSGATAGNTGSQTMQQTNATRNTTGGSGGTQSQSPATPIRVGETINGTLSSSDSLYPDNSYFRFYQFTAPSGPVTIDLSSDDFDPVLIVRGSDLDQSIINDDGGPGCSSRVSRTFPSRGPYRILVNTTANPERQTGRFSLSITEGTKPVQEQGNTDCTPPQRPNPTSGGGNGNVSGAATHSISVGQTQQGTLTRSDVLLNSDSTYAQAWSIQGRAGQTVTIDLESDSFDSYLFLRGPGVSGGRDFQDDDSGGNCHARLTATFPQNGEYEIVVNTADKYATGGFTLSVTNGSKPKSVTRCSRSQ